ncbi:MAG: cadherin domain-containing protein [Chitinophagales bacterium]
MKTIYNSLWGILYALLILIVAPSPVLLSQTPTWSVNPAGYANTMTITAELNLGCERSTDTNDLVGIFDSADNCRGVANVINQFGSYYVFLTAYSNASSGETLSLKIYDDSADTVYDAVSTIEFVSNAIIGTVNKPTTIQENNPPTDINISSSGIQENQPIGTVVGAFTTADEDDGQTFAYSLVSGEGDTDNASFTIDGADLESAEVFDMETKDSYLIRVQTTDSGGCSYEEAFTIIVNDGNDPPTDIDLSNSEVAENEDMDTFIGSLTSTDTDPDDTHTYSLVPGDGDDDNESFAIDGEDLVADETFDFETKDSYTIRLQTEDNNGGTYQEQFTITITDANDFPTAMTLDNNSIAENESLATWIATMSSIDQDVADFHTYTLVNGEGDDDNASFSIAAEDLVSNEVFNFEVKDSYTIRLQTDDGNGGTYEETFTITITDVNDAPTDISLSSYDVEENKDSNTFVAAFSTTDEDSGDSFTYSLVAGDGDADNGSFQVVNGQLFTDEMFDFEAKSTYSIRVQTDDGNGGTYEEIIAITINDTNDGPTAMALDNSAINENEAKLTFIGSLSTTDEDAIDNHAYQLVSGSGDDDNSSFIVQGNKILAASSFNFETKSLYTIRVQTTDKDNETYSTSFIITIKDINDMPSQLTMSSLQVAENLAEGTVVGTFNTSDEDLADVHTYSFVNQLPNDHDAFYVFGNTLRTNTVFDYETDSTYIVYIETNDGNGGTLTKQFFIKITNANDAPTALSMSSSNVKENKEVGTIVATLSSTDIDDNETFTYSLVAGGGSEDNGSFQIVGQQLQTAETFNFEDKATYFIRLRTTDSGGKFHEQAQVIQVTDANDAPYNLELENIYFQENLAVSTVVSSLSTMDEDPNDNHFYSLVSGEGSNDNSSFSIVGGLLLANVSFDYESKNTYSIRLRTQDNSGGSFEKQATIHILDANENPVELTINNTNISENAPFATSIGVFNTVDPDIFDTHFYSFANITPNNNNQFIIVEDELRSFETFDYETQQVYFVYVQTNDGKGGIYTQQFIINVNDANDAPTALQLSSNTIAENLPESSNVGYFNTTDEDAEDNFTYALVSGFGGEDNASFKIEGNQLISAEMFDLDTKSSYSILVRTYDKSEAYFDQIFTILITDANDAPTALSLANPSLSENNAINAVISIFSTTDEDANDTFTYTLVGGQGSNDNSSFAINGNQLLAKESFNFEAKNQYNIRVQTNDGNGGMFEEVFTISIQNANDAPTMLAINQATIEENQPVNSLIGAFTATDEDTNETFTYSFVNEGSHNNQKFQLVGNELRTFEAFNYEAQTEYYVNIKVTDKGNASYTKSFLITILNANDAPTALQLSSNTIAENLASGSKVGNFTATDEDFNEQFTYSLVSGINDDDNEYFQIVGNELQSATMFDLDTKSTYQIRAQVRDKADATYEKAWTITITDANDAPTAMSMSSQFIAENQPIETVVGSLSTADVDANDTFTYSLVSGSGDNDNGSFHIVDNQLVSAVVFNYEVKNSYTIRIQTDDGNGGSFEASFVVQITNANDLPIGLNLNNNLVSENVALSTPIGNFATVDEDSNNSFVYTFINSDSNDNAFFSITDNTLYTNEHFNFEAQNVYHIEVQTNDGQGGTFTQQFTINITNANDQPTALELSSHTIAENLSVGSNVGFLSTTDEDSNDDFSYSLVAGIGANDNASFKIIGNELVSNVVFDLDTKETYSIRVRTSDGKGGSLEKIFAINITDANDAPTAIALSNLNIEENKAVGTLIGTLSTTDPDELDNFTYKLIAGTGATDNSRFVISGNQLLSNKVFNYEQQANYSIRVLTDDGNGGKLEVVFSIKVLDANDAPTAMQLNQNSIAENKAGGTLIGTLSTSDEDAADALAYTFVAGNEDNTYFVIEGNQLKSKAAFNFEDQSFYQIAIVVNDGKGGSFTQEFVVSIIDQNDAPSELQLTSNTIAENLPINSTVGFLETADEDANESFTYSLVAGEGSNDNAQFKIVGSELKSNAVFDLDVKDAYSIRIRTTDSAGSAITRIFNILITDTNDAPTALLMEVQQIAENQPIGTIISQLSTQDPDALDQFTYQLVNGTGSQDNSSFAIIGKQLVTTVAFNFEVKNSYNIRLQTNDGNGGTFQQAFTIAVTDENDAPTLLKLSNAMVSENQSVGVFIGTFSTVDEDTGDSFAYKFINSNENDNSNFTIEGNTLRTNTVLDFETKAFHTIEVETNDGNGGTYSLQMTITVTNTDDDAPTAISITRNNVPENQVIGTIVGKLSTQDIDGTGNFTYTLAAGLLDNDQFAIDGDALLTNAVFNYEVKNSYQIVVKTEDENGSSFEQNFTIAVTDENDQPTAIALSNQSFAENQAIGVLIGSFSTTDEDANDSYTYRFVELQANDNELFSIVGGELLTNATFNFEGKETYWIDVETDDNRGGTKQQSFQITILDANDAPSNLSLSNESIAENQAVGTLVGLLSSTDEDISDSHTFSLVTGLGAENNDLFAIADNQLLSNAIFDLETQPELRIRIRSTDAQGKTVAKAFIITVKDENDTPTELNLSSQSIAENQAIGTSVGTLSTLDPDGDDVHSYELIEGMGGEDNALFSIQGKELVSNAVFDFESKNTYSILVQSSDGQQNGISRVFTIQITDANDAPAAISLSPASIAENQAIGTYIGSFTASDQDATDSHQFQLVNSGSGNNNDHFSIVNNELRTFKVLDFEAQPTYFIEVMADDMRGGTLTQILSVSVTNANDAPTALTISNNVVSENAAMGALIGTFFTTDIDAGDVHTYNLVAGAGSVDNASFSIAGADLLLNTALDINQKDSYSIRVATSDIEGKTFTQTFNIQVTDVNNAPTAVLLSNLRIRENEASGTIVGSLLAEDADVDDEHSFELVTNENAPHSEWFKIEGGQLVSAIIFNYELNPTLQIAVKTTDSKGSTFEQAFTIEVLNVNEMPQIVTESLSIAENTAQASTVGTIEATDEDLGQTLTFELVNANDVPFQLDAATGELTVATNRLDYESQTSYTLEIVVNDNGSPVLSASKTIEVKIEDLIETSQILPANNYLSPNGDGSNDYFEVQNVELYADFELTIFNANGEEIFYQASGYQNDWDGTYNGEVLPTGVYYYLFRNVNDSEEVFKGTISIGK